MRVVFFSHYFPPEGNAPASRTYVAPNAGAMKRIVNYVSYLISALFAVLFFCKRPNLIVATSPQFFCGWAGTIASWLKWCPFILEIRDIWPESIIAVGAMKEGYLTRILEWLEKWMYRSATHIVAVGEGYKNAILTRDPHLNNISVITNGVDLENFSPMPPDDAFLHRWGLKGKFVCSYVGTIGMAHGLEVAINAAQKVKEQGRSDICFCLVGDGARRKELEIVAEQKGLQSLVVFTGRLPKSDMRTVLASSNALLIHLKACDLFTTVIPSKMFEAMAMERPIILGVEGEARKILTASKSGINVQPDNADQLTEAVSRLCDDAECASVLSSQGRPFVSEHYARDVLAKRYLKIMQAVAARTPIIDNFGEMQASPKEESRV